MAENIASHDRKCGSRHNQLHDWSAHWKCGSEIRDQVEGQCHYAQQKLHKIGVSLGSFFPIPSKQIGRAFNQRKRDVLKRKARRYRRAERKRREKLEAKTFEVATAGD